MNKILNRILSRIPWTYIIILIIALVITLVAKMFISTPYLVVLFGVFFTIGLGFTLFIWLRELYWVITKKDNYDKKN